MSRREFLKFLGATSAAAVYGLSPTPLRAGVETVLQAPEEGDPILAKDLLLLPEKTEECMAPVTFESPVTVVDFPLYRYRSHGPGTFDYNLELPINFFVLPPGFNTFCKDFYYFRDPSCRNEEEEIIRTTILPDTMGTHNLLIAFLDRGKFNRLDGYVPSTVACNRNQEVLGTMTYWVGEDGKRIYPNKIGNLLIAFEELLKWQERNGPLKAGKTYSYLNLIGLSTSEVSYLPGYNSGHAVVRAGGVCAGATALANAFWRLSQNLGMPFEQVCVGGRESHDNPYALGPFAPPFDITDTTVYISPGSRADLLMRPPCDCYISPLFAIVPNRVPTSETAPDGLGVRDPQTGRILLRSDATLIMNVAITRIPPRVTSEDLREMREAYFAFRQRRNARTLEIMGRGARFVEDHQWRENSNPPNYVVESIYPAINFRPDVFEHEMETSPYLQDVKALMEILNSVDQYSYPDMAALVRNSSWYHDKMQRGLLTPKIERGIDQLNFTRVEGQPVQCVQWAILLASLNYGDSPLTIGAAIRGPNDLIPSHLLAGRYRAVAPSLIGGSLIADPNLKIEEINPGDLLLIKNTRVGHVGVFLAVKDVGGKRYVLGTDANRQSTGRIVTFVLTDENFDFFWGPPPNKKIILTKNR